MVSAARERAILLPLLREARQVVKFFGDMSTLHIRSDRKACTDIRPQLIPPSSCLCSATRTRNFGHQEALEKSRTRRCSIRREIPAMPRITPNKSVQLVGKNVTPANQIRQSLFNESTFRCRFQSRGESLPPTNKRLSCSGCLAYVISGIAERAFKGAGGEIG